MNKRSWLHIIFWVLLTLLMTLVYNIGMPGYGITLVMVLMFIPLYAAYFYTLAYIIIPKFFAPRRYARLIIFSLICIILATLLFRIIEITLADPFIYRAEVAKNGPFVWRKLDGSFIEQLFKPVHLVHALNQTNIVVFGALSIKFLKMWYEKKQVAMQAELNFLKGQLHPHFLFNTLNNLYALTLKQSPQSPAIVLGLSGILRYMLYECNTDSVLLKRDVEILTHYVDLEKLRYEERLDCNFSISGSLEQYYIPPLLMLPLVENAFKHGTSETINDPWINIDLRVKNHTLVFKIANSKPTIPPLETEKQFGHIGLKNVHKRLELLFPGQYSLQVFDEEEEIYAVILQLSLQFQGNTNLESSITKQPQTLIPIQADEN